MKNLISKTYYITPNNTPCTIVGIVDEEKQIVTVEYERKIQDHSNVKVEKVVANKFLFLLTETPRGDISRSHTPNWFDTIEGWKSPIHFDLLDLFNLWQGDHRDKMDLNPPYQRDFVWTEKQQSEYLQAILDKKVEPVIHTVLEMAEDNGNYYNLYEVLDGKQRLTTLFHFLLGKNSLPCGAKFSDLSAKDASFFLRLTVHNYRLHTFDFERPLTNAEKLDIFLSINAKGTKLTEEDLEHAKKALS